MLNETEKTHQNEKDSHVSRRELLTGAAGFSFGSMVDSLPISKVFFPSHDATDSYAGSRPIALVGQRKRKSPPMRERVEAHIHINQVGYLPGEPKRAVVPSTGAIIGGAFTIIDDAVIPTPRFHGELQDTHTMAGAASGHFQRYFHADFGDFRRPGRYRMRLSDGTLSSPFSIQNDVYQHMAPLVSNYFDIQRCGLQHSDARSSCHVDDGIVIGGPRDGQKFDASGGWHDAGDYLKFVETTSYVTAVMLFTYARFQHALQSPHSRGGLPPLLVTAKFGLDWLLKMHPGPEEFYYQVGDEKDHDSWRLPEEDSAKDDDDWKPRPVLFGVGANLAGRTAAALAMASRLYRPYDPKFSARCLNGAVSAYQLGLQNPRVMTTQPADFYPETTWKDDMEWGAVCLYEATGNKEYLRQALTLAREAGPAYDQTSVYNSHALAHATLYPHADPSDRKTLLEALRIDAECAQKHVGNPYGLATPYIWGTAEAAAGAAINCLLFASLSYDKEYVEIARLQRDYILGCNPFNLCCVIGAGTRYPLFPHHQVANIRNIELSGALVGGPTSAKIFRQQKIVLNGSGFSTQNPGPPAKKDTPDEVGVYHDSVADYVTNEPANDYTAKFLLMIAFYLPSSPPPV